MKIRRNVYGLTEHYLGYADKAIVWFEEFGSHHFRVYCDKRE